MSLRANKVRRWAQAQRSQQNVGSVTHDLSVTEEVLMRPKQREVVPDELHKFAVLR